jgi:hypothetical protein
MKIVLNNCYGGFNLSYEAMALYLYAKGETAYFYKDVSSYKDYTKIDKYERISLAQIQNQQSHNILNFVYCTTKDQGEYLDHFPENVIYFPDIDRADPILVHIVETIGSEAASGRFAQLEVYEITDNTLYKIDTYDGLETIITQEDEDWETAEFHYIGLQTQLKIENMWDTIKPTEEKE